MEALHPASRRTMLTTVLQVAGIVLAAAAQILRLLRPLG